MRVVTYQRQQSCYSQIKMNVLLVKLVTYRPFCYCWPSHTSQ